MRVLSQLLLAALILLAPFSVARADQQLWAAAYVDWSFDNAAPGVEITQPLWVPRPATASFFTLNWDFEAGDGGYIGLQSNEAGEGNARFSLWNATASQGGVCRRFDGEGEGMTCELPVPIALDAVYHVRVERGAADARGQWWIGWLHLPGGEQRQIGALRVNSALNTINAATVHNFSEFWGEAVAACRDVPLSVAAFAAPTLTLTAGEAETAAAPVGRRPDGHPCASGRERTGAAASHTPLTLAGQPAMLLALGGAWADNRATAAMLAGRAPPP